jgi:hypothetical protein
MLSDKHGVELMLSQGKLDKIWEVATTVGKVEGWSADDQGDVQLLVPDDRERHGHYERREEGGSWKMIPGMDAR